MKKVKRAYTASEIETALLTASARRCCLCFGIDHDYGEKNGQIAHVDRNRSNSRLNNLAWLCLEHHDKYDSKTSQSKGYTIKELKSYRNILYLEVINRRGDKSEVSQKTSESNDDSKSADLKSIKEKYLGSKNEMRAFLLQKLLEARHDNHVLEIRHITDIAEDELGVEHEVTAHELEKIEEEEFLRFDLKKDEVIGPYTRIKLTPKYFKIFE